MQLQFVNITTYWLLYLLQKIQYVNNVIQQYVCEVDLSRSSIGEKKP